MEREPAAIALNEENAELEIDLFDLLHFILRRIKWVILSALFCTILGAFYAFILATPMYEATSQLYVVNPKDSALNLSDLQIGTYLTKDYELVFQTWEVNQMVINNLSLPYTVKELQAMVSVTNPSDTRALFITVTSSDAAEATRLANEFAEVGKQYITDTMLSETPTSLSVALQPTEPVAPRKKMIMAISFVLGALICTGILTLLYLRDDKIKTASDLRKYTGSMPLAVLPINDRETSRRMRKYGYGYYYDNEGRG